MTRTKFVLVVALIALFIGGSTTYGLAEVRYYTVTNDTDYTAEVILCWTWGSQYVVKIYAHKSYAFPDDSPYHCPSGLKGKLSYGIFTTDIVPICLKNRMEGSATACEEDCTSSNWKINIQGTTPHFVRQ